MPSSAYSNQTLVQNRKIAVDANGVIVEHPIEARSDGTLIRQHFVVLNQGGDPVFFLHGDSAIVVGDVTLWTPLQAVISPTNAADETIYRATLGGTNFDYTSDAGDGDSDIATGLQLLIDANAAYTAEVVGDTCVARSATQTPFTVATSIQGGSGGAGTIANATPEEGADNVIFADQTNDEWTGADARMALICESGNSATVYTRYRVSVAQPVIKAL
jgi:hypothetical protein